MMGQPHCGVSMKQPNGHAEILERLTAERHHEMKAVEWNIYNSKPSDMCQFQGLYLAMMIVTNPVPSKRIIAVYNQQGMLCVYK